MKYFFLIYLFIFQEAGEFPDTRPDPDVTVGGSSFGNYFTLFADLMLAAGALIGMMAAARIYMNWNLGLDNIWKNTMNLWLGCVMLVTARFLIFALI